MANLPTTRRRTARWLSPWRDINMFDRLFPQMDLSPWFEEEGEGAFIWAPRVDFAEQDGKYVLTAELPGIDPKDVDVEVEGNVLTIRGEKKLEREKKEEKMRISERQYGSFERTMTLPPNADPGKVTAKVDQGVLKLEIEKRPEARGRKIDIGAK
jgi:HSP20 family protein